MGLIRSDGSRTLSIRELGSATAELEQSATQVELDDEIVSIFLEEAVDILESAGQALQRWLSDPDNGAPLSSLQRDLHTLKGGARMAEVEPVGDLAHELESLYEGLVDRRYSHSEALAQLLQQSHDRLAMFLDQLQHNRPLGDPGELIQAIREFRQGNAGSAETIEPAVSHDSAGHDPELLEIFLEEGFDIIENSGAALALPWRNSRMASITSPGSPNGRWFCN